MSSRFIARRVYNNLYLVRQVDLGTKYFESIWEIPEGIVYNSYILHTSEGAVVFDTIKKNYCREYIDVLRETLDLRDIKYIVLHHGEPDHSGCVKELSDKTNTYVIGHTLLGRELSSFYGLSKFKSINDNESLKIGEYTIVYHHVPWLHWPETIVSHIVEENYLFTCDIFGSYGAFYSEIYYDELVVEKREEYITLARKYFANIIGFYREWVSRNLEKLVNRGLKPSTILPAHGLAYRGDSIDLITNLYSKWSRGEFIDRKIVVVYTSMYRFVEETVYDIVSALEKNGFKPRVYGFNDMYRSNISDIVGEVYDSEIVVVATSSYDSAVFPITKYIVELFVKKIPRNKNIIVIGAYGWGYRSGQEITGILSKSGFKVKTYEFQAGQHRDLVNEIAEYIIGSRNTVK